MAKTAPLGGLQALTLADDDGVNRTISFDSRLPTTIQMSAASPSLMASAIFGSDGANRSLVNQPKVSRHPAVNVTSGLAGFASKSTKTAWITISAAMTEHTTRTTVARSEKTRAVPLLAMTASWRSRGRYASRRVTVSPVHRGRRAGGGRTAAAAASPPARWP